jgi:hypothetical protein
VWIDFDLVTYTIRWTNPRRIITTTPHYPYDFFSHFEICARRYTNVKVLAGSFTVDTPPPPFPKKSSSREARKPIETA